MENLPKDPAILLSWLNTMLRDKYPNLAELCDSMDIDKGELIETMKGFGFIYFPEINQFR